METCLMRLWYIFFFIYDCRKHGAQPHQAGYKATAECRSCCQKATKGRLQFKHCLQVDNRSDSPPAFRPAAIRLVMFSSVLKWTKIIF